jgi:hypothetical protein
VFLRLNHPDLLPAGLLAMTAPLSLAFVLDRRPRVANALFQPLAQFEPREFAIGRLGAFPLASHLNPGGPVPQPDRGARFVDLLPARASTPNEAFLDLLDPDSDCRKPGCDLGW